MLKNLALSFCLLILPQALIAKTTTLSEIQDYLNQTRSMEAPFEQLSPNGDNRLGLFKLLKPGKLLLTYRDSPDKIFTNDGVMYFANGSTQDLTQTQLDQTVADILISEFIVLDHPDIIVGPFEDDTQKVSLTLKKRGLEEAGTLTMVFQKAPLKLIQWKIVDAQGQKTIVNLKGLKENSIKQLDTDPKAILGK
jgi:outer membrane lipoprotein-sorting protein